MLEQIYRFFADTWAWAKGSVFNLSTLIEICLLSVCIYYIMLWFKKTKAWTLLRGILVVIVIMLVANLMELRVISTILQSAFSVGITAIFILFQPELRRALEQLGRNKLVQNVFSFDESKKEERFNDETLESLVEASYELGSTMTGALIVIEQETPLGEYEKTGIPLDACITSQLLVQIFEHNTPLHDGAVIIRNNRIVAATCYLPVSGNMQISKALGTRHRAGIGISEVTDSFTIIVSEQTGHVSIAIGGELIRNIDSDSLRNKLRMIQKKKIDVKKFKIWRGKQKA